MKKKAHSNQSLSLQGEFTIYTAEQNKVVLLEALTRQDVLQIDLSGITEIDGAGLQLLIAMKKASLKQDRDLSFSGHSSVVLDAIDLCNLSSFFGDPLVITGEDSKRKM